MAQTRGRAYDPDTMITPGDILGVSKKLQKLFDKMRGLEKKFLAEHAGMMDLMDASQNDPAKIEREQDKSEIRELQKKIHKIVQDFEKLDDPRRR